MSTHDDLAADNQRLRAENKQLLLMLAQTTEELCEAVEQVHQLTDLVRRLQEADDAAGVTEVEALLGLPRVDDLMGVANACGYGNTDRAAANRKVAPLFRPPLRLVPQRTWDGR